MHSDRHSEEVIVRHTREWLEYAWASTQNTRLSLQTFLSLFLCDHLLHYRSDNLINTSHQNLKRINTKNLWTCESGLVLLCCHVQKNVMGEMLPAFLNYVETAYAALEETRLDNQDFLHARWLLHYLGYGPHPYRQIKVVTVDINKENLLMAECSALAKVVERIAKETCYGTVTQRYDGELATILQVCTLHTLKNYDFVLGASLLRTLAYLGYEDTYVITEARRFIMHNQSPEGFFGKVVWEAVSPNSFGRSALEFTIPATLASLWALAETAPRKFRLYSTLLPAIAEKEQAAPRT